MSNLADVTHNLSNTYLFVFGSAPLFFNVQLPFNITTMSQENNISKCFDMRNISNLRKSFTYVKNISNAALPSEFGNIVNRHYGDYFEIYQGSSYSPNGSGSSFACTILSFACASTQDVKQARTQNYLRYSCVVST